MDTTVKILLFRDADDALAQWLRKLLSEVFPEVVVEISFFGDQEPSMDELNLLLRQENLQIVELDIEHEVKWGWPTLEHLSRRCGELDILFVYLAPDTKMCQLLIKDERTWISQILNPAVFVAGLKKKIEG